MADFTDEEGYGRYLDMHECYEKYINLKGVDVSLLVHMDSGFFKPELNNSLINNILTFI